MGRCRSGARRQADQPCAQADDERAEQGHGEHEQRHDPEGGVGRVVPGGGGGDAGHDDAAGQGRDAEHRTDDTGPQPLHGRLAERPPRWDPRRAAGGQQARQERGEEAGADGDDERDPGDGELHRPGDGALLLELPEPPAGKGVAGRRTGRARERGDQQRLGRDGAADLARVAPVARSRATSRPRRPTERATVPAVVKTATAVAMPPKEPPRAMSIALALASAGSSMAPRPPTVCTRPSPSLRPGGAPCCCPPDSSPGRRLVRSSRPTWASTARARRRSGERPRAASGAARSARPSGRGGG